MTVLSSAVDYIFSLINCGTFNSFVYPDESCCSSPFGVASSSPEPLSPPLPQSPYNEGLGRSPAKDNHFMACSSEGSSSISVEFPHTYYQYTVGYCHCALALCLRRDWQRRLADSCFTQKPHLETGQALLGLAWGLRGRVARRVAAGASSVRTRNRITYIHTVPMEHCVCQRK